MNKRGSRAGNSSGRRGERRSNIRYRLKASYEENKRIYTVLDISADSTLDDLCCMILDAFDFTYEHLYLFNFDGRGYGEGDHVYFFMPEKGQNGTDIRLSQLNLTLKQKFYFLYNFGDDWGFDIQVQKIYETDEHVINGIVTVIGELKQYPVLDEEDFDALSELDIENLDMENLDMEELEELVAGIVGRKWCDSHEPAACFRISSDITVKEVLDTLDEDDLRSYAAVFLGDEERSDCLVKKNIDQVRSRYAQALLQNKEHMLLFLKYTAGNLFQFLMTAEADEESGVLDWNDLCLSMPLDDEVYAQEFSLALMYLYSIGVCMPEMNEEDMIQSFLIPQEMRDAYGNWLKQPEVCQKQSFYDKLQETAIILVLRYGVIEMDKLYEICQCMLHEKIKEEDFAYLISSRLVYFGRFDIYVLEENRRTYVSAFDLETTEDVVHKREDYPNLTYRSFSLLDCENYITNGPFWDVEGYQELVEAVWKSVQDVQVLSTIVRTATDLGMLGTEEDRIIGEIRLQLNASGKRMTRKLQGLIRNMAKNMPRAVWYGYTTMEQNG